MTPRYALAILQEHLAIRRGESVTYVSEWELVEAVRTMAKALETLETIEADRVRYEDTRRHLSRLKAAPAGALTEDVAWT